MASGAEAQSQAFTSWHAAAAALADEEEPTAADADADSLLPPPFAIDESLNRRLVFTRAPQPWLLQVDALVLGNNEALSDRVGVQGEIFDRGGAALAAELRRADSAISA